MAIIKYKNPDYAEGKPKYLPLNIPYYSSDVFIGNSTPTDDYKVWINPDNNEIRYKLDKNWNLLLSNSILEELYAYGVEWDVTVADPACTRIGNLTLHKTLPIQSEYKGCLVKNGKLNYYLNPNDWNLKPDSKEITVTTSDNKIVLDSFDFAEQVPVAGMRVKCGSLYGTITAVEEPSITVSWDESTPESITTIILGSILNGDDGDVCVHIPKFYGRSWVDGNKRRVMISKLRIDETWQEIPEMYMGAYRLTCDTSTNKARSVVNFTTQFRGGSNSASYDQYLTTDKFRTMLGKPRTAITRSTVRTWCNNAGCEPLCYEYYKWVFYWAYVIEYANFNCQAAFNADLTSEGYHQGGLGSGVTNFTSYWPQYNNYNPITPCGFCNTIGNFTGVINVGTVSFDYTTSLTTNITSYSKDAAGGTSTNSGTSIVISKVSKLDTRILYCPWNTQTGETVYTISGLQEGQSLIFYCGSQLAEATSDGDITVTWPTNNTERQIRGSVVGNCNITISIKSASQVTRTLTDTIGNVPRWRGFDNPFGDIWTILDGIVIKRDGASKPSKVWTSERAPFTDNYNDKKVAGIEVATDGYIKEFDLGIHGEIIPSAVGGGSTTYKCDYYYCNPSYTTARLLVVGGGAYVGSGAGFGCFVSNDSVGDSYSDCGFRFTFFAC